MGLNDFFLGADVANAKFGAELRDGFAKRGGKSKRICGGGADEQGGAASAPPRIGGGRQERKVGDWESVFADVLITGVAHDADNLIVCALAIRKEFVKRLADRIFAVEKNFHESLIDDGGAWCGVRREEIPAVDERNFHGFQPAGRDMEEIAECREKRGAIDRDGIVVGPVVEKSAVGDGDALDAGNRAELAGELQPSDGRNGIVTDSVENEKTVGGEASGLVR